MQVLSCAFLVVFALGVGIIDLRTRRIPNWLNVSGALVALVLAGLDRTPQVLSPMLGLVAGLGIGFLLFLMRLLGAGDAKFMGAIGAWAGLSRLPIAFLAMLAGGALVALIWSWRHRMMRATLMSTATMLGSAATGAGSSSPWVGHTAAGRFPYGVGLGLGAIVWWLWEGCRLI